VAVALPDARALNATLDLPGRLEAYSRAPIFARVSGYLKSWSADIGAKVTAGQVIAEIEAPDLDQQLLQARADLASQQASAQLSEATLTRRRSLIASNFVSMQEIDERTADLSNKKAAVKSGQANVERLEALAGYKKITVPFDGVVTARDTDVGALINAGGGAGPAMFIVSDISKLRVYVNVPQSFVPAIRIGAKAVITVPDYPSRTFDATVEASSQSVDVASGTTRMQLALDNAKGELMPGGYASVKLSLVRDALPLHIPASALIFNQNGLRVATVGLDDKVLFKTVTIARDLGRDIELASGISADDRIITAPPDGLIDGDQVRVVGGATGGKPATASEKQDVKG
jgi:RND family efflux transporter MFP subunit